MTPPERNKSHTFLDSDAIITHSLDAIIEVSPDGVITGMNPAAEKLYGFSVEEMVGKPIGTLFPPEQFEDEMRMTQMVLAGGGVQSYETKRTRKDGSSVEVSLTVSPVKDGEGRIISTSRISRDISVRKRQEERLKVQAAALNAAACAIIITDINGMISWVNPAFTELTGYSFEEVMGKKTSVLKSGVQGKDFYLNLWRTILSGSRWQGEIVNRRKDGSLYTEEGSINPVRDNEGKVVNFVAIKQDVTERKKLNEALSAAATRFRSTLDHMMEGCQIIGRDFKYIYMNDVAAAHARMKKEELIGHTMTEVYPDIETTDMFIKLRDCIENKVSHRMENLFVYPDGGEAWFDLSIVPVPEGAFVLSVDTTERRRNLEELARHRGHLETLVKERTAQLEEANKELESFSYSVSHDLRAPLRHIDGFVDLLRRNLADNEDDKTRRYLDVISSSARSMGTLIDELLVFSRMGRSEMRTTEVSTADMVTEVIASFEQDTANRNIRWKIGRLPIVEADPSMLRLVFTNLISNAIKYSSRKEEAEISVSCRDGNGEYIFCVKDNGVGFEMQYAGKLFGVFQRLHRPEDFEGTGIGLANVRRIINRHAGRTWAEGTINEGASFYFTLPRNTEKEVA